MKSLKYALCGLWAAVAIQAPAHAQFAAPDFSGAPPNAIRVLATNAIAGPLNALRAQAEQTLGKPIVVVYGSARGNLKTAVMNDQEFDVALLVPDVDVDLLAAGKIKPGPVEVARAPIAMGIRGDAPADLNMKTTIGVRRALVNAKGVKYSPTGAGLFTVRKIYSTLGIRDQISDLSTMRGALVLHRGEYEITISPESELMHNKALQDTGVIIPALQVPADVTASISTKTRDPAGARALVDFLRGPAIDPILAPNGMIKGRRNR